MSNLLQLLIMLAVPAVFFLTCRFVNQRANRTAGTPAAAATANVLDSMGAIGRGAAQPGRMSRNTHRWKR